MQNNNFRAFSVAWSATLIRILKVKVEVPALRIYLESIKILFLVRLKKL